MKFGPIIRIVGVVVLGVAALGAVGWLDRLPPERIASALGLSVTISDQAATPTPTPPVLPVADRASALSLGTVAVQTFAGSSLVRMATGTVVASDGLVVTTTAGVPYGSGSYVHQITTVDGRVARARRVATDIGLGLVLLKAETSELRTVPFAEDIRVRSGDELSLVGATIMLSRYVPVVLPAHVVYAVPGRGVALSVDRSYLPMLIGSRVVDDQGRALGIVRAGSVAGLIEAATVNAFVDRYLSSLSRP